MTSASITVLNKINEDQSPYLVPYVRRNLIYFSPLTIMVEEPIDKQGLSLAENIKINKY